MTGEREIDKLFSLWMKNRKFALQQHFKKGELSCN